jgi:hypothetical protein
MKNNKHVESFGKFNENLNISDVSDSEISELIKRKNNGEVLNFDEIYILHTYFYKNSKEFRDKYNDIVDKLLNKD